MVLDRIGFGSSIGYGCGYIIVTRVILVAIRKKAKKRPNFFLG